MKINGKNISKPEKIADVRNVTSRKLAFDGRWVWYRDARAVQCI